MTTVFEEINEKHRKQYEAAASTVLTFGKHSGKTVAEVATVDREYLQWMAKEAIKRNNINYSDRAWFYLNWKDETVEEDDEDDEGLDVCPICFETSCDGPKGHSNRRRK